MSSSFHDAEAKIDLLPKHTKYSADVVTSDNANDHLVRYRDSSMEDDSLLNEGMVEKRPTLLRRIKRGLRKPPLIWTFFFALVAFSFAAYFLLPLKMNRRPKFHPVFGDCGKTPQEARAKGCIYDPLAVTWLRPECYYPDLIEEFIDMEPVRFYRDKSLSNDSHVPMEEIIPGQHEQVWAPHKFHSVHCAHVVKKLHHALGQRLPIDSFSLNYEHTEHCQLVLLEELPLCSKPGSCRLNNVIQQYSSCGYLY